MSKERSNKSSSKETKAKETKAKETKVKEAKEVKAKETKETKEVKAKETKEAKAKETKEVKNKDPRDAKVKAREAKEEKEKKEEMRKSTGLSQHKPAPAEDGSDDSDGSDASDGSDGADGSADASVNVVTDDEEAGNPPVMEYEMEIMTVCPNEEQRVQVEKEILTMLKTELKMSPHDYNISSHQNELAISCKHELGSNNQDGKIFQTLIRRKLYDLAIKRKICFEVDFNSEFEPIGTCFIGIGEDDRETDYLLEELMGILPKLLKRSNRLSKRFKMNEDDIKRAVAVLLSMQNK